MGSSLRHDPDLPQAWPDLHLASSDLLQACSDLPWACPGLTPAPSDLPQTYVEKISKATLVFRFYF